PGNHAAAPRKPPPSQQRKTSTATPGNTGNPTPITTTTTNEFNRFERNHYACDSGAQYPSALSVPLSVQLPEWLIEVLDREACRMGISRQTVMKVWLTERADVKQGS
ncbi:MAG: BrnA antitoxin family protein, partial [Bifidobacterium tibiigranuli]|nr:BrnA antitoxin family protein [Bifidobacterium tibiigranuli]MCH4275191.1 BrnA antitoxin family protein [Bifidobacterium tibiigranuli]